MQLAAARRICFVKGAGDRWLPGNCAYRPLACCPVPPLATLPPHACIACTAFKTSPSLPCAPSLA